MSEIEVLARSVLNLQEWDETAHPPFPTTTCQSFALKGFGAFFKQTYESDVSGWFSLQTAAQMAEHRCHREKEENVYKSQYWPTIVPQRFLTLASFSLAPRRVYDSNFLIRAGQAAGLITHTCISLQLFYLPNGFECLNCPALIKRLKVLLY